MAEKTFALIGCGKAGLSVALALKNAGWTVAGCDSRNGASAQLGRQWLACPPIVVPQELPPGVPMMIGVPEQAIPEVDRRMAAVDPHVQGRVIFHLSGALPSRALNRCRMKGAIVGSLHPLMVLPDPLSGALALRKATFAVEGRPEAVAVLKEMAASISGKCFSIPPRGKVLYHAAAVTAANHLVALIWESQELLHRAGATHQEALPAFEALVTSTVHNVFAAGAVPSLTGPVERGDLETVRDHLRALKRWPESRERYRALAKAALELARLKHPEREEAHAALEKLLA